MNYDMGELAQEWQKLSTMDSKQQPKHSEYLNLGP